jgi:mono/diheme cytochrome c family protein
VYQRVCASCHQPAATGVPGAFPPLAGNPNITDPTFVEDAVRNGKSGPIEVNGQSFDAVMPPVTTLSDAEISAVADYVAGLAQTTPTTTAPAPTSAGDPARGETVFSGSTRLANGGPACVACHAAGSHANSGAGLGPDLSGVAARLGGVPGLSAWLSNPASPTMSPVFTQRPLSEGEIADLAAYLAALSGPTRSGVDWYLVIGASGTVLLFAAMALVAIRKPRRSYVARLRSNP